MFALDLINNNLDFHLAPSPSHSPETVLKFLLKILLSVVSQKCYEFKPNTEGV